MGIHRNPFIAMWILIAYHLNTAELLIQLKP